MAGQRHCALPCMSTEVKDVPTMQKLKASMCRNPERPTLSEVKGRMIRGFLCSGNWVQNCVGDVNKLIIKLSC